MQLSCAIIGTAGRKDDIRKLTSGTFNKMVSIAKEFVLTMKEINYEVTHLVSGGAAWADHIAVKLFLGKVAPNLVIYSPCKFNGAHFCEDHIMHSPSSKNKTPSEILNYYHQKFSRKLGSNTLPEINEAILNGARFITCPGGLHGRNTFIANADILLAFTFGDKEIVKPGGTADTLKKYLSRVDSEGFFDKSFHYNLNDGKLYPGAKVPLLEVSSSKL